MAHSRHLLLRRRAQSYLAVLLLYILSFIILGPALRFSQWNVNHDWEKPAWNQSAGEAISWLQGRLDLPAMGTDTATYQGRSYNIFPPLWTFICFAVYGFNQLVYGELLVFFTPLYIAILALPVPILIYLAFRQSGARTNWAVVLALYAMAGTCLWPVAAFCRSAWIYSIQHVMSQVGLAILLFDLLGRRRYWLGALGLVIAIWSRQLCLFYAAPLLWMAWKDPDRKTAVMKAACPIVFAVAVLMVLNWAKFGSPFDSGYRYIYSDRTGGEVPRVTAADGSIEIFALRYLPGNFYHMWLDPPWFDLTPQGLTINGSGRGTAIWCGTPLLFLVIWDAKRWWRDKARRGLMLASLLTMSGILLYHGPGFGTPGYYRYTLDFSLVWLVVIAPWTRAGWRRYFTLLCFAWSLFYYYMVSVPY